MGDETFGVGRDGAGLWPSEVKVGRSWAKAAINSVKQEL